MRTQIRMLVPPADGVLSRWQSHLAPQEGGHGSTQLGRVRIRLCLLAHLDCM